MNARTITSYILAVALIAPVAGVFAAEKSGQVSPYTGRDQAVMTTASNTEITRFGRDSGQNTNDTMSSPRYARPALETAPADAEGSVVEVPAAPVVVEGDMMNPEPTLEERAQKFRTALGQPSVSTVSERRLANGALEVTTSLGRFCTTPPPRYVQSGLGGDIALVAPCALF
jgi:hypothetical protein